ncbi:galactitol-1-phosphate 5-dehydrogenase [Clostridium sp. AM58-1XD]|uniref:zinc-dependent alcohol dehydrogenase n=1 Tax=Clostridium sp. AM58-1XD TaxID=2292307 RepID=UPI000E4E7B50|nr:galactitol-1-phosphate 5-dehydrogenase [Clostridium sp. AM58-1XD]RGY97841.1 galactitol-1-phosphate 5-dehydrogenase [Clostridium sp. AM58-1XD]
MKALILTGYTEFMYTDVPTPVPGPDEVLIRLKACSICGSDIHGCQGRGGRRLPPIIMGHEASGIVARIGINVKNFHEGDRVTFDSTEYCGCCDNCRNGMTNLCNRRKIVGVSCTDYKKDGAMAEYIAVKAHTLYRIPDSVTFEEACLIEPLAVGLHAVKLSGMTKGRSAVIIGDGTIGLMTLQAARAAGAEHIILVGMQDGRLAAASGLSRVTVINNSDGTALEQVMRLTNHKGADIIYDAAGLTKTMEDAFSFVKTGGTIVCIGNTSAVVNFPLQDCIVRQIRVLGSYSSAGEYSPGLELIQKGLVDLSPFTRQTYPLSQGEEAFRLLMDGKSGVLKVVLTI